MLTTPEEVRAEPLTEFPLVWDSTMVAALRACPRKLELAYINGWQPKGGKNVHLHAGGAWAKALEVTRREFYSGRLDAKDAEAAGLQALVETYGDFECPPDVAKSLDRMVGAFAFYFDNYPLQTDPAQPVIGHEGPMVEFTFAIPLEDVEHPVSGEPLIYAGRTDMIAHFADGIYVFDDKTTSSLGASWSYQWHMRSQFTGYVWAAQQMGMHVSGALVRGVSILKTKFDTQQVITGRPEYMVDQWRRQLTKDLTRAKQLWLHQQRGGDAFDFNLDESCNAYGGCTFRQVCSAPNPAPWLETYFEIRPWNPLAVDR